jgi:hypothetical protein
MLRRACRWSLSRLSGGYLRSPCSAHIHSQMQRSTCQACPDAPRSAPRAANRFVDGDGLLGTARDLEVYDRYQHCRPRIKGASSPVIEARIERAPQWSLALIVPATADHRVTRSTGDLGAYPSLQMSLFLMPNLSCCERRRSSRAPSWAPNHSIYSNPGGMAVSSYYSY